MTTFLQHGRVARCLGAILIAVASVAPASAQIARGICIVQKQSKQYSFGFQRYIRVPAGAPNGTVLASTTMSVDYSCPSTVSPTTWSFAYRSMLYRSPTVPDALFINRVPSMGVGVRVTNLNTGQQMKNSFVEGAVQWMPPITSNYPFSGTIDFKLELVKTDDDIYTEFNKVFKSGYGATFGTFTFVNTNTGASSGTNLHWLNGIMELSTIPKSCRATLPATTVPLNPVWVSQLPTAGATAGDKPFNVGLSCSPGTNVYVSLTDLTNPGNTSDQLTLTPDSTASGVKLRLLTQNGTPASFGSDSAPSGNPNRWYLGASGTLTSIPLTAQYIATGPAKAGSVKGLASFTLSYQ
ncbi:fimbrial protein [Burkholderia multivorans]|uniref:fimbrial protein n=1 Tax=Burkholderia multivorans TaxID=87883 RepID=UPI001C24D7A5|nr:fimbrial protein [Burkholderia multivorans]MBU9128886.1 fimbrial protein [Burkholderia multivorans]